jgi:hypothetical protein
VPVDVSAERPLLLGRLTGRRRHVISQLEGLSDEELRRPVLPSGWSCLALVRHLTLSDERYWFAILEAYRSAISHSDEIVGVRGLDDAPAQPEEWWGSAGLQFPDLRTVLVHVLVETATHAGQLDAVRELIDGRRYLVL